MEQTSLTFALGIIVEAWGTFSAEVPTEVVFAGTLAIGSLAVISQSSIEITLTRPAVRVTEISFSARVAVGGLEFDTTLAVTGSFFAVSGRVEIIALASCEVLTDI